MFFVFPFGQGSKVDILDEDVYVAGISYFPPSLTPRISTKLVSAMSSSAGIILPKRQTLKALLTSLGHQLFKTGKVELKVKAGITSEDVKHL